MSGEIDKSKIEYYDELSGVYSNLNMEFHLKNQKVGIMTMVQGSILYLELTRLTVDTLFQLLQLKLMFITSSKIFMGCMMLLESLNLRSKHLIYLKKITNQLPKILK